MLLPRLLWLLPGPRVVLCSGLVRSPWLWAVFFWPAAGPLQVTADSQRSRFSFLLFPSLPSHTSLLKRRALPWDWRMALITNACSDRPSLPKRKPAVALAASEAALRAEPGTLGICCSSCFLIRPRNPGLQEEPHLSAVSQEAACPS